MEGSKCIKYDWYQSVPHVFISVLVKNVNTEDVRIDLHNQNLICTVKVDDLEQCLSLQLAHAVKDFTWRHLPSKIEIRLRKLDGIQWSSLIKEESKQSLPNEDVTKYPSSKPVKKDWDKLAYEIKKQEEEEHLEGEAALNQMFQKIYADASDETKRAMNKSFIESGGTVLSTNWQEVSEKKVEIKPPDGMEWKKWET